MANHKPPARTDENFPRFAPCRRLHGGRFDRRGARRQSSARFHLRRSRRRIPRLHAGEASAPPSSGRQPGRKSHAGRDAEEAWLVAFRERGQDGGFLRGAHFRRDPEPLSVRDTAEAEAPGAAGAGGWDEPLAIREPGDRRISGDRTGRVACIPRAGAEEASASCGGDGDAEPQPERDSRERRVERLMEPLQASREEDKGGDPEPLPVSESGAQAPEKGSPVARGRRHTRDARGGAGRHARVRADGARGACPT
jgi:hypothetical protein